MDGVYLISFAVTNLSTNPEPWSRIVKCVSNVQMCFILHEVSGTSESLIKMFCTNHCTWEKIMKFKEPLGVHNSNLIRYSGEHGISHTNLYVIKKKLSSLSFIVIIVNHEICDHD
jgi:hypothetical protein